MQKHNFSAGPAILPPEVIQQASAAVANWDNSGLSLIEVSHRGKEFVAVMDEAQALVKEILGLNDEWEVMYLQGGASMQFCMIPYNFLSDGGTAAYMETGTWAKKAAKEAANFGTAHIAGSSKETTFNYIPKDISIPENTDYFHFTTNNTIYGTQIQDTSRFNADLSKTLVIADMSSDIFSAPLDISQYDVIYAGAQKNLGPAGTTLVIMKKALVGRVNRTIPTMLNYKTHIDGGSMFNTPPVFPIYTCMLTLRWIKANGGLEGMKKRNEEKANLLYKAIDESPIFEGTCAVEDRSKMNVTFVLKDSSREQAFFDLCAAHGISGIKGHRSVGGFRASIYNAMDISSVKVLTDLMAEFAA